VCLCVMSNRSQELASHFFFVFAERHLLVNRVGSGERSSGGALRASSRVDTRALRTPVMLRGVLNRLERASLLRSP